MDKKKELELRRNKVRILAYKDFWYYLKTKDIYLKNGNKLYSENNKYLKDLAYQLQSILQGGENQDKWGICISMPPRHAKSLTVKYFVEWLIGINKKNKIGYVSYSQNLVNKFSRNIRNNIIRPEGSFKFNEIFGGVSVSKDNKSVKEWSLEGYNDTFKTGSFRTEMTGSGLDYLIVDDPIKNSEEAGNEKSLSDIWELFTDTFISRVENGKIIIIQTRWSEDDLIGMIEKSELKNDFLYVEMKALIDEEKQIMLNDDILDYKEYNKKKSLISPVIFEANYNQRKIDNDIALYQEYKIYNTLPDGNSKIVAVLDPALGGGDYTALPCGYKFINDDKIYLKSIFYNNKGIKENEENIVNFIIENKIDEIVIESNNAFILLSMNIKKALKKKGSRCKVIEYNQRKNKESRIVSLANLVQQSILWMPDCESRYREAFTHFKKFKTKFKDNKHDDIEDAITLLYEYYLYKNQLNKMEPWEERMFV